jgi:hypothetical protein
MQDLTKKAVTGLIRLHVIMALMLFVPAWTVHFWKVVTAHFLKHDPGLVESRLKAGPTAEHEKSEKVIQTLTAILWCALIIVPGIERHFHSARIPVALVLLGDVLVAVGYYIIFLALRENRWAASIIEVQPGQSVIATGPYSIVRHPMYFGRCVDDSCHAAGLGLALGVCVRGVALRHHRSAAPRRGTLSLKELARLRGVLPEGPLPTCPIRLVNFLTTSEPTANSRARERISSQ